VLDISKCNNGILQSSRKKGWRYLLWLLGLPYFGIEIAAILRVNSGQFQQSQMQAVICASCRVFYDFDATTGIVSGGQNLTIPGGYMPYGLEFSLTALFVVLAIEQYKNNKNITPFVIGAISSIVAIVVVPINNMLIFSIICSLIAMFIFKKRLKYDK